MENRSEGDNVNEEKQLGGSFIFQTRDDEDLDWVRAVTMKRRIKMMLTIKIASVTIWYTLAIGQVSWVLCCATQISPSGLKDLTPNHLHLEAAHVTVWSIREYKDLAVLPQLEVIWKDYTSFKSTCCNPTFPLPRITYFSLLPQVLLTRIFS